MCPSDLRGEGGERWVGETPGGRRYVYVMRVNAGFGGLKKSKHPPRFINSEARNWANPFGNKVVHGQV